MQEHFLFSVSCLVLSWSVLLVNSLFMTSSCHFILRMSLRHLFMNIWSFLVVVMVTSLCLRAIEQHAFYIDIANSDFIS